MIIQSDKGQAELSSGCVVGKVSGGFLEAGRLPALQGEEEGDRELGCWCDMASALVVSWLSPQVGSGPLGHSGDGGSGGVPPGVGSLGGMGFVCPICVSPMSRHAQSPPGPVRAEAAMLGGPRQGWWGRAAIDLTIAGMGCSIPGPTPPVSPSAPSCTLRRSDRQPVNGAGLCAALREDPEGGVSRVGVTPLSGRALPREVLAPRLPQPASGHLLPVLLWLK